MVAIKDASWKVEILTLNKRNEDYYFSAKTKDIINLTSSLIEDGLHTSKELAKEAWESFAKLNGISKWKFVE